MPPNGTSKAERQPSRNMKQVNAHCRQHLEDHGLSFHCRASIQQPAMKGGTSSQASPGQLEQRW